jgi:MtN3 and saliva related transmembrane protein
VDKPQVYVPTLVRLCPTHWFGIIAGTLTTAAFVPQVIRILQTKQTNNISLTMYILSAMGVAIWIYYGLQIESLPVVIFNIINLVIILIILVAKLYWK